MSNFLDPIKDALRLAALEAEQASVDQRVMRAFRNGLAAGITGGVVLSVMAYVFGNLLREIL